MMGNEGISVADALALRNSGNGGGSGGFGDDNGAWWIIILILLFGANGWGRNGFGNNGNGGGEYGYNPCCAPATAQGMTDAFNFNQIDNALRGLSNGLCDGFYAMNNSINGVLSAIQNCCCQTQYNMAQGFCGVDKSIMQTSFQNQTGFNSLANQLAQCCCDVRYDMASQACDTRNLIQSTTRDIIENQNNNTRSILDFLVQDKLDTLRDENMSLKNQISQINQNSFFAANQDAQTAELIRRLGRDCPVPAFVVPNPNCCYPTSMVAFNGSNGYGCGCGCG